MRSHTAFTPLATLSSALLLFAPNIQAQTYSDCNPTQGTCPADTALGGTSKVSLSSGASSQYSGTGNTISYDSTGAQFSVAASGNNPTLTSSFYIMFGHVDFVFKAAPGVGMVSSAILLSDDLDEIDWEILGYQQTQAQTNYFSKGVTGTVDPGELVSVPTSQTAFNTYSIDWTADTLTWSLNGAVVRTLTYAESGGIYPQTPMRVKIGSWAGGDSTNSPGTIQWAGGPINYSDGPFVMAVESISVTDYSTGTQYEYGDTTGTWQSIKAIGGTIGSSGGGDSSSSGSGSGSGSGSPSATTGILVSATLSSSASFSASSSSSRSSATTLTSSVFRSSSSATEPLPLVSTSTGTAPARATITSTTTTPGAFLTGTGTGTTSSTTPTGSTTTMPFDPNSAGRSAANSAMLVVIGCFTTAFVMFWL